MFGGLTSVANSLRNLVVYESPEVSFNGAKLQEESILEAKNDNSNVYFRDAFTNEVIGVELTSENIARLQNVFGGGALENIGNGKAILSGRAEEFVSGWYADIAHKRGYLRADTDFNGILSAEEKKNTTSFFGVSAFVNGNSIAPAEFLRYSRAGAFSNTSQTPNSSDSIAQELNKTLEYDKDMDGRILWGDTGTLASDMEYLKSFIDEDSKGYVPPSIDEFLAFLKQTMEDLKKMSEEELKKVGIDSNAIDLTASAEEVFKQIMENPKSVEALKNIKEKLENQGKGENGISKANTGQTIDNVEDNSTFAEISKLTKLDKETLAYNLQKNPNFEEDIISLVQELTQNVDRIHSNTFELQRALDILA